ncbi:MAG TPA: glycosyltransferase [Candidatus Limnocylindrales bacterium]
MSTAPLRVIQVTKVAQGGGAERIASSLHQGMLRRGQRSWMATARNDGTDPLVLTIPPPDPRSAGLASRGLRRVARALGPRESGNAATHALQRTLRMAAAPRRSLDRYRGRELFDFPGTAAIPDLPPEPPDVVHCHNLHGGYFDLRQLAPMSHRLPLAMTLHDEWTFTGHCGYGISCERWRTGCGLCPDLTLYPAIPRDGTRANWRAKRAIYTGSRLYVSTPSQWLMDRAQASILAGGAAGWRMIPNGVDRSIFRPGDRTEARARLGLPVEPFILLFAANKAQRSPYKDWATVSRAAARAAAEVPTRTVLCLALGDDGPSLPIENGELRFVPYRTDILEVAAYFQAADVYLHAARAENLPTTILEALATGLPVVATAVGGIPEEVRNLASAPGAWSGRGYERDRATGVLVAPANADDMGAAAAAILRDDDLRATLSANAAADAAQRFDLDRQLDTTIDWYREIIADWRDRHRVAPLAGTAPTG